MTTRVVKSWRIEAERMPLQVRIEIASETHGGRDTELVFNSIDSAASFSRPANSDGCGSRVIPRVG